MQVILLEKIANLGNLGDVVKVKDGYARNFLIPGKHARRATEAAIKEFETRRAELEKAAAEKLAAAQALQEQLSGKVLRLTQKAGVDGRLFGSDEDGPAGAEVAGAHAQRTAEDDRRAQRLGLPAHRRGGRDHRARDGRGRLIGRPGRASEGRALPGLRLFRRAQLPTACAPFFHSLAHRRCAVPGL